MKCACGSAKNLNDCCGPYLAGEKMPATAEELMRSRYTAFTKADVEYIKKTLAPESRTDFDENGVREWATKSKWLGLEIVRTEKGGAADTTGVVEFIARYAVAGQTFDHHEIAEFRKEASNNQWFFVDGKTVEPAERGTIVREAPKVGRNDACPCGSGKKYKKCCGQAA